MLTFLMFISGIFTGLWIWKSIKTNYSYQTTEKFNCVEWFMMLSPILVGIVCAFSLNDSLNWRFSNEIVRSAPSYEEIEGVEKGNFNERTVYYWKVNPDETKTYVKWERSRWSKFKHTKDPNSPKTYIITTPAVFHPNYLYSLWSTEMKEYELREGTKK